jgi:trans-aconitate methyltransferase
MSSNWADSEFNASGTPIEWLDLIKRLTSKTTSVLDLGCGKGRFAHLFKDIAYLGLDISQKNIDNALQANPKQQFECADLTKWDTDKKYDLIFSWVSLQHIDPFYFPDLAERMNKWGKHVLLCEHVEEPDKNDYLWRHDYDKYFDITFTEPIVDKVKVMYGRTRR